jgi:hypothetical protein
MDFTLFKEFGFAGLSTGALFFILWRMIVWVMAWVKEQDIQHAKEREALYLMIGLFRQSIVEHNERASAFHTQVTEAHKYQRDEHAKMIENQSTICNSLKEVEKALGRINGYIKPE